MTTYLFSGFDASDLTGESLIGIGDSFTVPGATTHRFRVEDDDGQMSGDTLLNGKSNDLTQSAQILRGSTSAGSGTIFVDEIYTLQDSAGNTYTMYWLVMEGSGEDFYVFQGASPAPGTSLTVTSITDATSVSYDQFGGDDHFIDTSTGAGAGTNVSGGAGNDTIYGASRADTISGGEGNDELYGENDADFLYGGAGDDRIHGGDGMDHIEAGPGADTVWGGAGNDTILGGEGNDLLYGGVSNDSIHGGAGNDTIEGDGGDDMMLGGTGSDVFVLRDQLGKDTIQGGEDLDNTDLDWIDASRLSNDIKVKYTGAESGTIATNGGSVAFSEIEWLLGTEHADKIDAFATTTGVSFSGGGGNDTLLGGAGNDTISGGKGADQISGGAGNDTLHVSSGDSATGGAGDDLFLLEDLGEVGAGNATIAGGDGFDTLNLGTADQRHTLIKTLGTDGYSGSVVMNNGSTLYFSQIEQIICFTAGTRIATPFGPRPAEDLRVGDLVLTRDHGPQPLRWTGSRRIKASGDCAPIRIRPGVLRGLEHDLLVSPQHRMLYEGYQAQLLFGEEEVLVAACHLVDGRDVTVEEGGEVTYVHLLFDSHEIIMAEGAATESFQPGLRGIMGLDASSRAQLFEACPRLRSMPDSWGSSARMTLRAYEAQALFAA